MPTRLRLCNDLDRTLLPNGPQPESAAAGERFNQLVEHSGVTLVYITGRDQVLIEQAIDEYQLPKPAYVIANVGSTIYELQPASWIHWEKWQQEISPDWKGKSHEDMRSLCLRR